MKIKNNRTGETIKNCDGYKCDKCGSNKTKTILIYTMDANYLFNKYLNRCENCKNEFWLFDR